MDCQDLLLIEALLAEGQRATIARDFEDAIPPLNRGLELLGQRYHLPDVEDDTDQKLLLADDFQRKDRMENAAYIKGRILKERIHLFKRKHPCLHGVNSPEEGTPTPDTQ